MQTIFQRVLRSGFRVIDSPFPRPRKIHVLGGILGIFFFLQYPAFSQPLNNFNPESEPDGFGSIVWGTDLKSLGNMEFTRKDPSYGGIDIFRNRDIASCLCGLAGEKIEYLFWKGRFCGVCFFEEGFRGYEQVRKSVFKEFGKANKLFPDQEYYVWEGEKTLMALEYKPVGGRILFWMFGVSILQEMEKPVK